MSILTYMVGRITDRSFGTLTAYCFLEIPECNSGLVGAREIKSAEGMIGFLTILLLAVPFNSLDFTSDK
ncbi:hypothetical protein [Algoriphagus sp.]|uniref:hypothetical protein n=1 Tax=Algoriphagus sp. TaxID=1872435 RepID=UPI00328E5669